MNILFFASRVTYGGGEKVRNWLVKQLSKKGHIVYYITESDDDNYRASIKEQRLDSVVKVVQFSRANKMKHFFNYIKNLKALYKSLQVDLIIIFGGSLLEQAVARSIGVKVVLSERFFNGFRPLASRVLKRLQYRVADGYVFQTPEASKMYNKRATRIGTVIPNPIIDILPKPVFDNLRKEVVNTGRLCDQKDQALLIRAFRVFHDSHPDYRLIIYGSGEYKDRLNDLIISSGLVDDASIISGFSNISERINGAALFVLSSKAEGMPNALIEAMSMGVLCISTDCPAYGSRMLIKNNENAILVPVGDEQTLASEMCRVIDDEELANAIRHNAVAIRERLNPSIIAEAWLKYLENVVK